MTIANTEDDYGVVAKAFHWVIAVLILGLLPVGLFMGGMEDSPFKFEIYALHKSFGLLVFFLGLARIVWRFITPAPDHLATHQQWEISLAAAAHFWLYVCIIGMPLSGWLMSSAGEYPVPFFGIQMPALMGKDESLGHLFYEIHEILGYTLIAVLALRMAGALKHHVIDKDETLQRMTVYKKGWLISIVVIVLAGASYGAMAVFSIFGEDEEQIAAPISIPTENLAPSVDTSNLPEHGWVIVPDQSILSFQAVVYNAPFTANFKNFEGTIVFNPDDLSSAFADISIDMEDVDSGDADRDKNMKGPEWFDITSFPQSHFVSRSFEKGDGDSYVAIGDVTIRGVTMPLIIPFDLIIKDNTAVMNAKFSLERSLFGVGQGQWAKDDTVGNNVVVSIVLNVVQ